VVHVQDSGYGIPSHQQEKIFSKFFRGDNVLQHDTNGTGLGLYLVFLLTRILRGTIDFKSEEGQGTTFMLTMPKDFYTV
jgi:signal transduction histidine kinase